MGRLRPQVSAADFLPEDKNYSSLHEASRSCRGCELYKNATQVVFGTGPVPARIMLVGTMPGDSEDKKGLPFVGPAGRLLDKALARAAIDRTDVYITNAVKHFKFVDMGHYRLHRNPGALEIRACRPWLEQEVNVVKPRVTVALGTLAAESLLGRKVILKNERGLAQESIFKIPAIVTIHPSAILRMRGHKGDFEAEFERFVTDLGQAEKMLSFRNEGKRAA